MDVTAFCFCSHRCLILRTYGDQASLSHHTQHACIVHVKNFIISSPFCSSLLFALQSFSPEIPTPFNYLCLTSFLSQIVTGNGKQRETYFCKKDPNFIVGGLLLLIFTLCDHVSGRSIPQVLAQTNFGHKNSTLSTLFLPPQTG